MARGRLGQSSWAWGELSDQTGGRIDLDQYKASARVLENYQVLEVGAVTRRPGTRYLAAAKYPNLTTALATFTFAAGQTYVIEMGEGYFRFFRNRAPILVGDLPFELATPYTADEVRLLKFAQSADVLYIASSFHPPQALERYSDTIWHLREVGNTLGGSPRPAREYGLRPQTGCDLTPGALDGDGVTFTAALAIFLSSEVAPIPDVIHGRQIEVVDGTNIGAKARIVTVTDSTHVVANILVPFTDANPIAPENWKLSDSPLCGITPSAKDPVNTLAQLVLDADGFRAEDAGKFAFLNGGVYEVGLPSDAKNAPAIIRSTARSVTKSQPGAWSLEEAAWSELNGYPAAVALFQDRAWWACTQAQPDTVWGSKSADFENFAVGVLDDDAVQVTLLSAQVNPILWLVAGKSLLAGTLGEIFSIEGSQSDSVLTPSNIGATPVVAFGARPEAAPLLVGPALIYPTVSGLKLREMVFDIYTERYLAPDLLLLANHLTRREVTRTGITERGLVRIAYQREPRLTLWGVTEDGRLLSCTYLRDEHVIAWNPNPTQGTVLDVKVSPREDGSGEDVYVIARRTIGVASTVSVEWLDDRGLIYDRLLTDASVTVDGLGRTGLGLSAGYGGAGNSVTATSVLPAFVPGDVGRELWEVTGPGQAVITAYTNSQTITVTIREPFSAQGFASGVWGIARQDVTGMGHLSGATVKVLGDGAPQADRVVQAGSFLAESWAIAFEVGLGYTSTLVTQRPALPGHQGQPYTMPEILVRVLNSRGLLVNGKRAKFKDQLYSGDVKVEHLGISNDGLITIVQDQPLPSTLLYVQALTNVDQG